jgi:hypothetical protein
MYTFLEEDGLYKIRENEQIIAIFDDPNKSKEVFHNLKRGGGFDGETPNFFKNFNFLLDN